MIIDDRDLWVRCNALWLRWSRLRGVSEYRGLLLEAARVLDDWPENHRQRLAAILIEALDRRPCGEWECRLRHLLDEVTAMALLPAPAPRR